MTYLVPILVNLAFLAVIWFAGSSVIRRTGFTPHHHHDHH